MKCKLFACVYARKGGCIVQGWTGEEGPLNGKKAHCPIYDVQCINAKCHYCGHNGVTGCQKEIYETPLEEPKLTADQYFFYEWLILSKHMTADDLKQLGAVQIKELLDEYDRFKQTLRGPE